VKELNAMRIQTAQLDAKVLRNQQGSAKGAESLALGVAQGLKK